MSLLDRVQRKARGPLLRPPQARLRPGTHAVAGIVDLTTGADRIPPAAGRTARAACPRPGKPLPRRRLRPRRARSRWSDLRPLLSRSAPPRHAEPHRAMARPGLSKMGGPRQHPRRLRGKVHQRLVDELAQARTPYRPRWVRQRISELLNDVITEQNITMSRPDRLRLVEILTNDVLGLGPLEELLSSDDITESWINSYKQIYVEQTWQAHLEPGHVRERSAVDAGHRSYRQQHRPACR